MTFVLRHIQVKITLKTN